MWKLFSGFKALFFLSITFIFYSFSPLSDHYQYVKRNTISYVTNEILQYKPQSYAISYNRKRYLKYQEKFPNVPFHFLYEKKNNDGQHCYNFEETETMIYNEININKLFKITINNQYWQEYKSRRGMFYLYNAYLDTRGKDSLIQITAIVEKEVKNEVHKCAIWYNNYADPDISFEPMEMTPINAEHRLFIGIQNSVPDLNNMSLYLLTCKIDNKRNIIPEAVSIVDHKGTLIYKNSNCYETSNYLKVNFDNEEKKDFAVCVKGYFFQKSHSTKLIEWIELLSILGAKKIFLHELEGNPDVRKVLDFYTKKGILDVKKSSIPGDANFRNSSYLKMHLQTYRYEAPIFLNDCLYRNIHKYKFIVITDIDEVIVPRELGHTWSDMMTSISNMYKNASSYFFPNAYFFDGVPEYKQLLNGSMDDIPKTNHMLRHVYRIKPNFGGKGFGGTLVGKSFYNTEFAKVVTSHRAGKCTFKPCKEAKINQEIAFVHHYRSTNNMIRCQDDKLPLCNDIVLDTRLWEFKEKLASRLEKTLSILDIEA